MRKYFNCENENYSVEMPMASIIAKSSVIFMKGAVYASRFSQFDDQSDDINKYWTLP